MKVLHVIPSVAPRYGGPSRAIFEMCRALLATGCQPVVATTDADGEGRLPVEQERVVVYEDVPTIFFPRQWSEAYKFSRPMARWLQRNIDRFDVAHIHAVFSHSCLAAAAACRSHGVPYIVRPLGTLDPWSMRQKPVRKRLMWLAAASRMLRGAAAVHYTTPEEKRLAEESLRINQGVVIPLGIDLEQFQTGAAQNTFRQSYPALRDGPYVLVLSRIHPKKNLEQLLDVFMTLTKQAEFADWRLVVAGDGDHDYVTALRRDVGIRSEGSNVIFTGWLNGTAKAEALRGAELLALVSHQENFGLCAAEGLACGVPVLVSRQVNLSSAVEEGGLGWVAEPGRAGLLDTLTEALRNPDERKRRGDAGREYAARDFAWPTLAAAIADLYELIVREPSTRPNAA